MPLWKAYHPVGAYTREDNPIRIQLVMPGPIRSEFFSSQGVSESVFPPESYLAPGQLVDAALAGLDAGESVTIPSMLDE